MTVRILHGDCLVELPKLAAAGERFHACVCDPPYHLGEVPHVGRGRFGDKRSDECRIARAGFMGKSWDGGDVAFRAETWRAVYDVLLPGAHLLAFSGTRTSHRMVCAIEDAGFEIRDTVAWLYGSGFPKSLDVSKAIDKVRDWSLLERLATEIKRARDAAGISLKEMGEAMQAATRGQFGTWYHRGGHMFFETGRKLPSRPEWQHLRRVLPISDEFAAVYEAAEREVIGQHEAGTAPGGFGEFRFTFNSRDITAASTPEAQRWTGWGTALKPAMELICVARKPLVGTVAENVLKHGCGGLNIDASRVSIGAADDIHAKNPPSTRRTPNGSQLMPQGRENTAPLGRWPSNVIHDGSEEVLAAFPDAPGQKFAVVGTETRRNEVFGKMGDPFAFEPRGDSGSAARFFYTAKADSGDRAESKHPTVKPTDLMRYLVRLVTPPGGTVLDPFCGTGSTLLAADQLGFNATGIEADPTYVEDARRKFMADAGMFADLSA